VAVTVKAMCLDKPHVKSLEAREALPEVNKSRYFTAPSSPVPVSLGLPFAPANGDAHAD